MKKEKTVISQTLEEAMKKFPHVKKYIEKIKDDTGEPEYYVELDRKMGARMKYPNLMYPVGDPIFIHFTEEKGRKRNTSPSSQKWMRNSRRNMKRSWKT